MDVDRLLKEEDSGWRELCQTFARFSPEQMAEPGITDEGWAARDVMFHIGAWLADCATQLERMRMGTYVDPQTDTDEQNRSWFELSRTMDLDSVKAEFHSARTRALQEWQAMPEVTADAWEWFEEAGALHYAKHLDDLRAWADRMGA